MRSRHQRDGAPSLTSAVVLWRGAVYRTAAFRESCPTPFHQLLGPPRWQTDLIPCLIFKGDHSSIVFVSPPAERAIHVAIQPDALHKYFRTWR